MIAVTVLGTGCRKCLELEERLADALAKLGRADVHIERVDNEQTILRHMPLDAVPGLLIDGRLVSQGTVPSVEILLDWLKSIPAGEQT